MRQREKRFISLFLSGMMLLSNLPFSALAEEVVEEETVIVTAQTPAGSRSVAREAADEEDQTEDYPVWVDGVQLTNKTEDDSVFYDPDSGVLTLEDADLESLVLTQSMTLALKGSNTIEAENGIALLAEEALTITGDGSLTVTSNHAVAMKSEDGTQGEAPMALAAPEGITLGKDAHVKFSQTTSGESFTLGSGYCKIGDGAFVAAEGSWTSDGSGLEFVGADHVQWVKPDTGHYKTCKDPNCPLATGLKLEAGDHNTLTTANCQCPATCNDCGAYGDVNSNVHTEPVAYDSDADGHWQIYPCCKTQVENSREAHRMAYSATGNQIDYRCELCWYGSSITLQRVLGTSYVYDGTAQELMAVNGIDGTPLTVGYRDLVGKSLEGAPVDAGNYVAWVSYHELEATMFSPLNLRR